MKKALVFAPNTLSLGCSLQKWGNFGSWSRGMPYFLWWPGPTFERQQWCGRGVSMQKSLWFFCSYV
jgi:hypothetical protein